MINQVRFRLFGEECFHDGILLDNGDVICGCCGGLIESDDPDLFVEEIYEDWVPLERDTLGE